MQERKIENFAGLVALMGLFIILFISENAESKFWNIDDIDTSMEGESIMVHGIVKRLIEKENIIIFEITKDSSRIKAIAFPDDFIDMFEGDEVEVEGKVILYNGEVEIEVKKIKLVSK